MSKKYFGTDGVRGLVGEHPITPQFFMQLGYAVGKVLTNAGHANGKHPGVLIGKDTRISGYMLESALQAGLMAAGVDVHLTGPLPTPAVAYLTRTLGLDAGIAISASHNLCDDNGVKFFSGNGNNLSNQFELIIEAALNQTMQTNTSKLLGKAIRIDDAVGRYIEFCKNTFPHDQNLRGIKLVVDSANGASYHIAQHVFYELGADVVAIGVQPDGKNINDGYGSTAPENLQKIVLEQEADFGIALDGDGDRLVMVDNTGMLYNGDQLLYVIAKHHQAQGTLQGGVVGTVVTNIAFEHEMQRLGIPFKRAQVGARYVMESLQQQGWQLGGESCGHIICMDRHRTADGIVSALQVLHALRSSGDSLAAATADLKMHPQSLIDVQIIDGIDYLNHDRVKSVISDTEHRLNEKGRVVVRLSGTAPLLRVMVEGEDEPLVKQSAQHIADVIASLLPSQI